MTKEYLMMLVDFYGQACASEAKLPTEYIAQVKEEWLTKIKEVVD